MSISAPATPSTGSAPRIMHGMVYGVLASMMMWAAIAAVVYELT